MDHACSKCGMTFPIDKNLHGHCTNSKLEICRICLYCDYNFLNKSDKQIRKHMKSKHSNVPCEFETCNRKFFLTGGLADHIRAVHCGETRPLESILNTRFLSDLQSCGNSLERLHGEKVRQDPDEKKRCNEIVRHLVNFMQHNLEYKVSEVVKGGSLGKGTSIKEKVDIDLVVFMKELKSVAELQEKREKVIKDFKMHILKDFTFAKQVHYNYDTKHSNRIGLKTDDGEYLIQVDLLPACDIGGGSKKTFRKMARLDEEARSFYSVSFAKDQVKFTNDNLEWVKDAIRLVKHWKTREKLNISSYTVEIITIKELERMGSPEEADLSRLFRRTMTRLSDLGRIRVTWPNHRATGDRRPIVMDPSNPFNNTASMIDLSDQLDIERKAQEIVSWL